VKGIRTSSRGPPGVSRVSSGTTLPKSLAGSQLRAYFQSVNFMPTPGKLLPDIQSGKMFFIIEIQKFPLLLE
jgi:hypothetical protein